MYLDFKMIGSRTHIDNRYIRAKSQKLISHIFLGFICDLIHNLVLAKIYFETILKGFFKIPKSLQYCFLFIKKNYRFLYIKFSKNQYMHF